MKKYITLLFVSVLFSVGLLAQENTATNFYSINPQILNPSRVGEAGVVNAYLNNRNQWYGLKGAPEFLNIGINSRVSKNFGIGVNYNRYTSGIFNETTINSSVSYGLKFNNNHKLRLGSSFGVILNSLNTTYDGVTDNSDLTLNTSFFNETFIKVGFGASYMFKDIIQVDIAVPEIQSARNNKYFQSLMLYVSYNYELNREMKLTPALMYRNSLFALNSVDFTLALDVKDKVWVMAGYRNTSGVIMGVGIKRNNFAVAYSYELDMSPMALVSKGTHEISVFYKPFSNSKSSVLK